MSAQPVDLVAPVRHPAMFNRHALAAAHKRLCERFGEHPARVLDPFSGTSRVHELRPLGWLTFAGELEHEWAVERSVATVVADALAFPAADGAFDAIVTSPTFGNRIADHHEARERCSACGGQGCEEGCGTCEHAYDGPSSHKVCRACGGRGSRDYVRNTYRHALGRPLSAGSSASMQFGRAYQRFHSAWLVEARRLVKPEGLLIVNMSNHIRKGVEVDVVGWWLAAMYGEGLFVRAVDKVAAPKLRYGANHELRVDGEVNIVASVPA